MNEVKKYSMVKPTIDTPLHIDFEWWKQHDNNWRVFLHSCLCPEHQARFFNLETDTLVDWIDPLTAEVTQVDGLQNILITHCAKQPDFLTNYTTLVDAAFRLLLANGNLPMSSADLAGHIGRSAETILRTLTGAVIYKGIRPCQ
ncbi:MAG: hypothetical protein P4L50_14630 [Anaerolineaceae bacterium]|nr:hypothetical protein [Anaerolineaceae bacterium]